MNDSARASRAQASMSRARLLDSIPPPPAGPSLASRPVVSEPARRVSREGVSEESPSIEPTMGGGDVYPFDAEIEMAELDERGKAGSVWSARARTLSRGTISVNSRRMCHIDRRVLIAVHRIDSEPAVLLGRVEACRYESGGLYVVDFELLPLDEAEARVVFSRRAR